MTITSDGYVLEDTRVNGQVTIRADDVVLRNVEVVSDDYYAVLVHGKNALIEDSTLQGGERSTASLAATAGGQFTARRVDASGAPDGVRLETGSRLLDSYVHDLGGGAEAHNDAVTADGHTGWEIVGNTILNQRGQTAAVWVGDPRYSASEGLLQGNYIGGGGYTIYAGPGTGAGIRVLDNVFTTKFHARSGYYGLVTSWISSSNTWSGNAWADGPNAGKPA